MSYNESVPKKIMTVHQAGQFIKQSRLLNRKIVFTNGVFDLMHKGHVTYLMQAADCGDELIIGLNADSSVKMLNKGPLRPLQDEQARALVLASLEFVSAVVLFEEETPQILIEQLSPDVLIKGGDYQISEIAGADHVQKMGGLVQTIPLVEGYSTSSIEERIKKS